MYQLSVKLRFENVTPQLMICPLKHMPYLEQSCLWLFGPKKKREVNNFRKGKTKCTAKERCYSRQKLSQFSLRNRQRKLFKDGPNGMLRASKGQLHLQASYVKSSLTAFWPTWRRYDVSCAEFDRLWKENGGKSVREEKL